MSRHVSETGQGAFTWTGPYGSGKSSLVVALSAALNGNRKRGADVESILGQKTTSIVRAALPPRTKGWRVLPVVGRRDRPAQVIGEAISASGFLKDPTRVSWTDTEILDALQNIAARYPRAGGGLIVFIDEMGKFLEDAAKEGTDLYLFQNLGERASRSGGRLIVVGILHQAFQEYANRLSRDIRDEWSKIQGRFVDLAVNASGEEQIDLLGRAIESDTRPQHQQKVAGAVARQIQRRDIQIVLSRCWKSAGRYTQLSLVFWVRFRVVGTVKINGVFSVF